MLYGYKKIPVEYHQNKTWLDLVEALARQFKEYMLG
jgi:hypothetical protein